MNSSSSSPSDISHAEIAVRARELWYTRGCPSGQDNEIWLEAEQQLGAEHRAREGSPGNATRLGAVSIDDEALTDRLNDFGDPGSRSVTSVDRPV